MTGALAMTACLQDSEIGDPAAPTVSDTRLAIESMSQSHFDNAYKWSLNSGAGDCGAGVAEAANMCGKVNGRHGSWKSSGYSNSQAGQVAVCNYGWCGWWPIGDCSRSGGDDDEGYSYGFCNSTAMGERFAGFAWNNGQKASHSYKRSGSTLFGYHPYYCFKYGDEVRTIQGWSYKNHCGGDYDYLVNATPPPSVCGNGVRESGEDCDLGNSNGGYGNCCSTACKFKTSGSTCRDAVGDCDVAETCSGSSAACPAADKTLAPSSKLCRAAAGQCDDAEYCTGDQPSCPPDMGCVGCDCTINGDSGYCNSMGVCEASTVPDGWWCDESFIGDNRCDCGCGAYDPDCDNPNNELSQQCAGGSECSRGDATCTETNEPSEWTCPSSYLSDGVYCDCGCGAPDPDCDVKGFRLYENCGSGKACSPGESTCHSGDYTFANGSSNQNNCPESWETDQYCDVGCQFVDPTCGGPF